MTHFEQLWEEAEKLLESETNSTAFNDLVLEIRGKFSVYEQLDSFGGTTMPAEDRLRLKTNAMGKLILVLTQISAKDGINVFAALKAAIDDRKISLFEAKYQ